MATTPKRRAERPQRLARRRLSLPIAAVLALGLLAGIEGRFADYALAAAQPEVSVSGTEAVLAGETASLTLSATNPADADAVQWYNLGFSVEVPNGVEFVSSGFGAPTVYASGATLPGTSPVQQVPQGQQVWVWQDVSDLPIGGTRSEELVVRPVQPPAGSGETDDPAVFPVGSSFTVTPSAHVSTDPRLLPVFPGSTGAGGAAAVNATVSSPGSPVVTDVEAIRVTKSEPSPESELLRGVHDHVTTYEIRLENTSAGPTDAVTVVDYLPAGLEYLGDGTVDHSQVNTAEYPGSGPLGSSAVDGYVAPVSVETVTLAAGNPQGLPAGVYTQVTWEIAQLPAGTDGQPSETIIRYAAGIPLDSNTADWPGAVPSPASLEQGANLDNNEGASTRHGNLVTAEDADPEPIDGQSLENLATASGTYAGVVRTGSDRAVSDDDTEVVDAMDLRVLKSVNTHPRGSGGTQFNSGNIAEFTLDLATSEYTSAADVELWDIIPNGLCPVLPAGTEILEGPVTVPVLGGAGLSFTASSALPADCALDAADPSGEWPVSGAEVAWVAYDDATGVFVVKFDVDDAALGEASVTHQVQYPVLMRTGYRNLGSTSSLDNFRNQVVMHATTTTIDALGTPVQARVADDSAATITSDGSNISKRVLPRSTDVSAGCPATGYSDEVERGFVLGDVVCYELMVDFAEEITTREPLITDMLPQGIEYIDASQNTRLIGADGSDLSASLEAGFTDVGGQGTRLEWRPSTDVVDGQRFVPAGSTLVITLQGRVTGVSDDAADLDKPQNLMKYQQQNVTGEVAFLRADAEIEIEYGPTLLKGVRDVDDQTQRTARNSILSDGTVFNSNRDGIQVRHNEDVTYRIDLTGAYFALTDLRVWDVLPEGVTGDEVGAISDGGTVLSPAQADDAGLAAGFTGRWVIVWDGIDLDGYDEAAEAFDTHTLTYTVAVPDTAAVDEDLDNIAAIVRFDVPSNAGETNTLYPVPATGPALLGNPPAGQQVNGDLAVDASQIHLPAASVTKDLVGTEFGPGEDPNNAANQAVEGELVTFRYAVEVPGRTTVRDGVLADRGTLTPGSRAYTVHDAEWSQSGPAGDLTGFSLDADGTLTFPATYTNLEDEPQTFTVELTVYLDAAAVAGLSHGTTLTNRASFTSETWSSTDDATVVYIDPAPRIAKTFDTGDEVAIDSEVTYTLRVENLANRPISYDNVVVDEVPAGLNVDEDSISDGGVLTPNAATGGSTITWQIATLPPTIDLTYTAVIDPATGAGQTFVNTAAVTGYTMPEDDNESGHRGERDDDATATVTVVDAIIAKAVRIADSTGAFADATAVPIGETVEYEVGVTLHPNINYYDPLIVDELPAGLDYVTGSWEISDDAAGSVPGTWDIDVDGSTLTWTLDGDILSAPETRTLTLTYRGVVTDAVTSDALVNEAAFSWDVINDDPDSRREVEDTATVNVLHPSMVIGKTVDGNAAAAVDPAQVFTYTLTATSNGQTPAHNVVVTDEVPAGIVVLADSFDTEPDAVEPGVFTGAGGTITWTVPGPISQTAPGNTVSFSYDARLNASSEIDRGDAFTNTAIVESWESFPEDGRAYGPSPEAESTVTPRFPDLGVVKAVANGDVAYADEAFGWLLTVTNTGDGPAQTVTVTDTLPDNWEYTAVQSITVGGVVVTDPLAPELGTDGDRQTLTWTFGQEASEADPVLAPNQTIVIAFSATPSQDALAEPGVTLADGTRVPHVNDVVTTATDTSDAGQVGETPYRDDDDAEAFIHSADLVLSKTGADEPLRAGTTGVGWTIVVENEGPDTAVGPFTVSDETQALPDGVIVTGAAGDGWACELPERATDGTTTFDCTRTDAAETLAAGDSFEPIEVTVQIADDQAALESVENTATVGGQRTHDPDEENNEDTGAFEIVTEADLTIGKALVTEAPQAGETITWSLTPSNLGPSVSQPTITVTDEIPEHVNGVTADGGDAWTCEATDGFPAAAGDTVTCTYVADGEPTAMAVGSAGSITLSGTIDSSFIDEGTIDNTALIVPGTTTDPTEENNDSSVETPPVANDTTVTVQKSRVVADGDGGWRAPTDDEPIVAGSPVSYLIQVYNQGPADASGVFVTDELPAGLTFESFTAVEGDWDRTGDRYDLQANLVANTSASFVITAQVAADVPISEDEPIVNLATVDGDNTPPDEDDDEGGPVRWADLALEKAHTGEPLAGESVEYTLTLTNEGPSVTSGPLVITDTLPEGFSHASTGAVTLDGSPITVPVPAIEGQDVSWSIGDAAFAFAPDSVIVLTFTADIAADVPAGEHINTAVVVGPDFDPEPGNNNPDDPTLVRTEASVTITKEALDAPFVAGETVQYRLTVVNAGPSDARTVTVRDALVPPGLTVQSLEFETGDGTWTEGPGPAQQTPVLAAGGQATFLVTALIDSSVPQDETLENIAEVTWSDSRDPDDTRDEDPEVIDVTAIADLGLVKTAVDAEGDEITEAFAGTQVRYRLAVTNHGPSDAVAPITVTDTLPAGLSFAGALSPAWDCTAGEVTDAGQDVTCVLLGSEDDLDGLAAGASAPELLLLVQIDPAYGDGEATNAAVVSSPTTEPEDDPNPNDDAATLTVAPLVDLSIVKSHTGPVRIGDELTFDLVVANAGPSTATAVTVTDTLPAGLEFVSAAGEGWSVAGAAPGPGGTTVVELVLDGGLEPGVVAPTLSITTLVHPEAYAEIANTASVVSAEMDADDANNAATDPVTVPAQASLVVTKEAVGAFQVGQRGTYRITLTNEGPTPDPGPITITDELPAGLTFAGTSYEQYEVNGRTVVWTVDGVDVGETVEIDLFVNVGRAAFPSVENTVTVDSPTEQVGAAALADADEVTVAAAEGLPWTGAELAGWLLYLAMLLFLLGMALLHLRRRVTESRI